MRDSATAPWRDLVAFSPKENGDFVDFTADGKSCYVESSLGSDVTRLVRLDATTGKELELIATDSRCDVGGIMVNDVSHKVEAVGFNYLRNEWKVIDPTLSADFDALKVNFRASTGFGKKFLHLGDRQWGGTMQDDLTDAVKWATAQGIADPKKVAIMGGSYGGYATLAGLTFTPDVYTCGVDIVGPSNLKTLLEATPPYWSTM